MRVAILALVLLGCSSVSPSAPDEPPPEETPAATPPPASTAAETPVTLPTPTTIMTGLFEDASPACNEWSTSAATAIRSVPARTGDYACKLCATGEGPSLSLLRSHDLAPGRYRLRAYVRTRAGLAAPEAAAIALGDSVSTSVAITQDWSLLETSLDVGASASVTAQVVSTASKSECLLVDDVILERL